MALDKRLGPCDDCGAETRQIRILGPGNRYKIKHLLAVHETHPARPTRLHTKPVTKTGAR